MVRTFLKVYMELGSSFLFLQEQIKDIIIIIAKATNRRLIFHHTCLVWRTASPAHTDFGGLL